MKGFSNLRILAVLAALGMNAQAASATQDEWEGLPAGPGREEVFYTCNACHSLKLVEQQGLDRHSWGETIDWMVEEQGMPEPDAQELDLMLDYLAEWYGRDQKALNQ